MIADDKRRELEIQADVGRKVNEMARTEAWTKIVAPSLTRRRDEHIRGLVMAEDFNAVLKLQAAIQEIEFLLGLVHTAVEQGKGAQQELDRADQAREE